MIHALDHIVLAANAPDAAVADYEMLLGRRADRSAVSGGPARASLPARQYATGSRHRDNRRRRGPVRARLRRRRYRQGATLIERRALPLTKTDASRVLHIAAEATHGVPLGLVERAPGAACLPPSPATGEPDAAVAGLDHVVIRSPNPERAVALYAGRLGLSLRLDRSEPAWGARLLFFRCGDLIVEVAHDLKAGVSDGPGPPVGPLLARARRRQDARASAHGRRRRLRHPPRPPPAHARLHGQEPHRRRPDAGDRR